MNKSGCLIISTESDYHACAVRFSIRAAGGTCEIVDTTKLLHLESPEVHISISDGSLKLSGGILAARRKSIWARRMLKLKNMNGVAREYAGYIRNESSEFEINVFRALELDERIQWVNKISSVIASEIKSQQLAVAARCGLRIPETLITADPILVRRFVERHGQVVIKPFNPYSWLDKSIAKKWTTFANLVDAEQLDHCTDQEIGTAPCIYQEYLSTVADIRVGVIGEKIFALSMRHKVAGKIDFRTMEENELSYERCSVPGDIEIGLKRTMRELDVDVASADFVIGSDGEWRFIELNPSGAFLFLENRCPDIKILSAAASLLCYGGVVDRYDEEFPSLGDFVGSADHARWAEEFEAFNRNNRAGKNITYLGDL
ncbi:MAG: hypothetical protein ACN6OU_01860 [Stenotrophomonas acidaminiphila]